MGYNANRAKAKDLYEQMKALVEKPGLMSRADEVEFYRLERDIQYLRDKEPTTSYNGVFDLKKITGYQRDRIEKITLCEFLRKGTVPDELLPLIKPVSVRLAQQSTTTTAGGHTIPQGFVHDLEIALKDHGGMWENARIVKTERGGTTAWGYTNDSSNKAFIIDESSDGTTGSASVVFGQKEFVGYKYTSGVIQVPNELLEDSELFSEEFINVLSERIFRGTNEHFSTGDGTGKPKGLTTSAVYGGTSASGTINYNDFVELKHSVDPGYWSKGSWMFHPSVLKQAELAKDDSNQPVFRNLDNGIILGRPFVINQDLPEHTAGNKSIFFGDFSKYIIRQARELRIVRFPNRYADLDQTAFAVFLRVDGDILNAGTNPIKFLRVAAT